VSNRLASEQSPYLLQHKDNPVDWYPWGEEAFARARREEKPIFLSIGYSTCHWCHVMEHESFEHPDVAAVLNARFIAIKVDREERPDIDRVYMTFVQATSGSGGWPMSVWLTPDLRPFYGGTYFPPTSRWGRPGFVEVLNEIARTWEADRDKVLYSALTIVERLRSFQMAGAGGAVPGPAALDRAVAEFSTAFDRHRGGFGSAPKFPRPSELLFLLHEHARTGAAEPRDMALATLRAMALGGMRDHVGGGFHRYSVDAEWRVPHFEKMLYDQAQLVLAFVDASQVTGDREYADVADDTLSYVLRDLTDPAGGFYSAEDADSIPPEHAGEPGAHRLEGAFYIWGDGEIGALLGGDADVFRLRYGIRPDGNAPADPQGEFTGKNLLYTAAPLEEVAARTGRSIADVAASLTASRERLRLARGNRPRPRLDDKVLAAWNGLMIAAFARAARVLPDGSGYGDAAARAAEFVWRTLWDPATRTLQRRYRNGEAAVAGYAEDYAYMAFGLLELFQTTGDARWLEWALTLHRRLDELFWDSVDGGWFSTTGADPSVLLRLKEQYDGAEPAASSVAVQNLLRLSSLTGDGEAVARVERTFGLFSPQMGRAVPLMMAGLSSYHAGTQQIVIVGTPDAPDTAALLDVVRRCYAPAAVLVRVDSRGPGPLVGLLPWVASMPAQDGAATAYVCRKFVCQAPSASPRDLAAQLQQVERG
jgi:uncharacterized protein YyaL (SSP411 family)